MRTLGGRPERHSEVRTSSFSVSVYNYIDVFLDNTGDPNTGAAVNQTETHEKHQKASQPAHPLPWGCISTAHVTADSPPAHSQATASTRWAGKAQLLASAPFLCTHSSHWSSTAECHSHAPLCK